MSRPWAAPVAAAALAVAVLSLAINLYLLGQLRQAQRALEPVRPLIEQLGATSGDGLSSEVTIPAGTPISLDVPVDERVTVRVDTVLPIRTRVVVPLRSPLGDYDVPVPIRADVPVRATLPLRLRHTFRLRTSTSSDIVVPIELRGNRE